MPPNLLVTFKRVLRNEVNLLKYLKHPNIIRIIEHNTVDGEVVVKKSGKQIQIFFLVLELVE